MTTEIKEGLKFKMKNDSDAVTYIVKEISEQEINGLNDKYCYINWYFDDTPDVQNSMGSQTLYGITANFEKSFYKQIL